jgi:multicomponent Na+:H+ antiporter subunit E
MKQYLKTYLKRWPYFLVMLGLWFLYHLQFDLKILISGLLASLGMTLFTSSVLYDDRGFKFSIKLSVFIIYFFILIGEIFKSAFSYVITIFKGDFEVIVFPLTLSFSDPIKVAMVANSITLTPGTVSVDINGSVITVMAVVKHGTPVAEVEAPIRQRFEALLKG